MNTEEGNKVIAIFMGFTEHNHGSYKTFEKDGRHIFESVLQYDTKWDWLMPVVEKIEGLPFHKDLQITGKECLIWNMEKLGPIVAVEGQTKIEAVWLAVTAFIQWYNQLNKTTTLDAKAWEVIKDEVTTRTEQWIAQSSFNRHSIRTYLYHMAKFGYALQADQLEARNYQLKDALQKSVKVIEQWHGKEVFDIYYNHAPEMKPIREALDYIKADKLPKI